MPWKECSVMDERLQFVAHRLAGEAMLFFPWSESALEAYLVLRIEQSRFPERYGLLWCTLG